MGNISEMRILCVPTLNSPVVFYRVENFIKYMRKAGHEVAFSYWGPKFQQTCFWERDLTPEMVSEINELVFRSDVVIFQAVHTRKAMSLIMALQESYRRPILAEYDDDIYSTHSGSPAFVNVQPGSDVELWGDEQITKADGLIVSTDYLKKVYQNKNNKVFTVPNAIDFEIWDNRKERKKRSKKIKIGWEGGAGHQINLRLMKNVVRRILDEFPNVEFHFLYGGYIPDYLDHKRIIFEDYHKWKSIDKYPQALKNAGFDIAIAPLRDLPFNRAKSNLRYLEYSALKIPTVASDVEPYKCIKHQETGFIAREEDEWIECLKSLIKSEELRSTMGHNAYKYVMENFNAEDVSKKYISTLGRFVERS